jgi:hypothetical protein
MNGWPKTILRLSGRRPDPAPETKSGGGAAAVFRRFFVALAKLERRPRPSQPQQPEER